MLCTLAATSAGPVDISSLELCFVFFYEVASHMGPQEEAEKRFRENPKIFILTGPRDGG